MANSLEYIFSLTDQVSSKLENISISSTKTLDIFADLETKTNKVKDTFNQTGRTLGALREKVALLQNEREWIPASNIKGVKAYNTEIKKLTSEINNLENVKGGGFKNWLNGLTASVPGLRMVLNPLVLISAGVYKLNRTINQGLSAWGAQTEAETKLAAVMRNTMNATDGEIKSILELTAAQQRLGVIGDEVQLSGAQELSTYVTRRDTIEKLLPSLNNMLAQQHGLNATQEQAATVAGMLGKVMGGQVAALSRYGYQFTEAQEKILKYGKETERAAVLAEVIEESVGGVNEALAQTPEGRWKQHQNEMGDLMERVGKLAVTFRASLFPVIENFGVLFENVVIWFEDNGEIITAVISKITNVILKTLQVVYFVLSKIIGAFIWWFTELKNGNPIVMGISIAVGFYTAALTANYLIQQKTVLMAKAAALWNGIQTIGTTILTAAQWGLNAAFYASPLGWVALAVGVVVAVVALCWQKFEGFRKVIFGTWNVIKEFGKALINSVVEPFKLVLKGVGGVCSAIMELIEGNFLEAARLAKQGFKDMGAGFIKGSPAGIMVNTFQSGNYAEAWEKGNQQGAESMQNSRNGKGEEGEPPADPLELLELPDLETLNNPVNDLDKTTKGKGQKKTLNLNDLTTVQDHNASATYTAITQKLNPVNVSLLPQDQQQSAPVVPVVSPIIAEPPTMADNILNEVTQQYEPKEENTIREILFNVRKIAAVAAAPLALAFPQETNATTQPQPAAPGMVQTYQPGNNTAQGKTVYIDRVTENINIYVENTDGRGTDQIRTEIYNVLNEILEG